MLPDRSDRAVAIGREHLAESKEKELLWSAVPALGIDPATRAKRMWKRRLDILAALRPAAGTPPRRLLL